MQNRKRAKTEDEKEQRRVERVLRNRRAAQSSRERKRQEVEGLEQRNKELEKQLLEARQANHVLIEELRKMHSSSGVAARATPSFDALRPAPLAFSQELFSSHDGHMSADNTGALEQLLTALPTSSTTVNPASLSPTLNPVPEVDESAESDAAHVADNAATVNTSPDVTQYPAVMLCPSQADLQCQSAEVPRWLAASQQQLHPALAMFQLLLISTSTMLSLCQRPLTQIAMSLKAGFSLRPTPQILSTIILLVTNPSPSRSSTSATSSPTTTPTTSSRSTNPTAARPSTRRSSSLRLKFLRKILTCSPTLARPLMDATMEALRLVSTEAYTVDRVSEGGVRAAAAANGKEQQQQAKGWLNGTKLPSKEVLMTLLWVLRVEERRIQIRQQADLSSSKLGRLDALKTTAPTNTFILKVQTKRSLGGGLLGNPDGYSLKRRRVE